jgi:glycosyltransferase involved in cell wall biosynthesis
MSPSPAAAAATWPRRVLVAHNAYRQRGGEDGVVEAESSMLRERGHEVELLLRHNDAVEAESVAGRARALRDCVWSPSGYAGMRAAIERFRPDVVHVHNTLPLLSPAIYWAAAACGVPVVQTLHNFRLACPQAAFLRDGRVCQDCVGRVPLPAVVHACYRGSRSQTFAVAAMLTVHRLAGTWNGKVQRYIALSRFCRDQLVAGGLPFEKIRVKPNFCATAPARPAPAPGHARPFLFVGRFTEEKGVHLLAEALRTDDRLECVALGDGPARAALQGTPRLQLPGWLEAAAVSAHMGRARALVLPSITYEPFALVTVEALAHGLPIIATGVGTPAEIIEDGRTGLLFEPGNARDLAAKMRWALEHPQEMERMGQAAREVHARLYSVQVNYRQLVDIYEDALGVA